MWDKNKACKIYWNHAENKAFMALLNYNLPLEYMIFMCIFCNACEKLRIICFVNPIKDACENVDTRVTRTQEARVTSI
jgi:hypothetical protein